MFQKLRSLLLEEKFKFDFRTHFYPRYRCNAAKRQLIEAAIKGYAPGITFDDVIVCFFYDMPNKKANPLKGFILTATTFYCNEYPPMLLENIKNVETSGVLIKKLIINDMSLELSTMAKLNVKSFGNVLKRLISDDNVKIKSEEKLQVGEKKLARLNGFSTKRKIFIGLMLAIISSPIIVPTIGAIYDNDKKESIAADRKAQNKIQHIENMDKVASLLNTIIGESKTSNLMALVALRHLDEAVDLSDDFSKPLQLITSYSAVEINLEVPWYQLSARSQLHVDKNNYVFQVGDSLMYKGKEYLLPNEKIVNKAGLTHKTTLNSEAELISFIHGQQAFAAQVDAKVKVVSKDIYNQYQSVVGFSIDRILEDQADRVEKFWLVRFIEGTWILWIVPLVLLFIAVKAANKINLIKHNPLQAIIDNTLGEVTGKKKLKKVGTMVISYDGIGGWFAQRFPVYKDANYYYFELKSGDRLESKNYTDLVKRVHSHFADKNNFEIVSHP